MDSNRFVMATNRMRKRTYGLAAATLLALLAGCGSTQHVSSPTLPSNVMAQPRGIVGIITAPESSALPTALRAIGVPFQRIAVTPLGRADLFTLPIVIIDEEAFEDDAVAKAYPLLLDHATKYGLTIVLLRQKSETLGKLMRRLPHAVVPRELSYTIALATPRKDDPVMRIPNTLTRANFDSLSRHTTQLVHGGPDARAIISANLDAPDSSAAMLWEPFKRGASWYLSFPMIARAAAGFEAEQKILANLVSDK
jgi:hypothetical protein